MPTGTVKEVFLDALAVPLEQRAAFLAQRCAHDPELRAAVEDLLRAHERAESMFGPPPDVTAVDEPEATLPERIGPYRLVHKLGEGGFGVVWLAEQETPFVRRVALKLLKATQDSAQVAARFHAERETLARMDHPGIARVLDAGTTTQQQPWVAIEYVDGVPITDYCDARRLPVRARLELFVAVCMAVQHAHHKGVVHRDLKPGNILVTHVDGRPVPKVIDFGIAKAIGDDGIGSLTLADQVLGTPEYMAPEQASTPALDIDTRADVYSLGVVLYRLLCGQSPYDTEGLRRANLLAWSRAICEAETPRPSTRVRTAKEAAAIAAARATSAERLARDLSGEVDWIVLRAMQKDRRQRYPTAAALAADIQRYLAHEPIEAGPPSALYRLRKFCRRHWLAAGATALAVLATTVALLLSTAWAVAATRARALAEQLSYTANLYAAEAALRRLETREANRRLAAAPEHLRGFEWHVLAERVDRSTVRHAMPGARAEVLRCRGGTVAVASGDGVVLAFDAATGAVLGRLEGLAGPIRDLAVSSTGSTVWCGDADGRLLRWECCTGARTERRVDGPIETLGLDAHDHVLATGQATCVRLWDADTLAPRAELPIDAPSLLVRCSPDGTRVAAGTFDGALSLWDVPERALLVRQRLARPTTAVEPPARYAAGNVTALAFSPDGESLAVGLRDGRIALLDADGDVLWTRDEHTRLVRHLDWSPDGRRLCAAGRDLRATIWSVEGALIANLPHPADVREVAWRDDGALVVTAAFDGGLRLFDAQGTARGELTGHEDSVYGVAFAQGGDRLWSYSGDRTVRQWPCGSALADALPVHAWCLAVAFAGRRLVAGDVFGQVTFFDFDRAGEPDRAHLELHGNVRNIAVAPRGDLLACGMLGGDVALLDPGEPRVVARFRAFEADVTSVAFSGDGALLAVGAATGALRAFSVATREALAEVCSGGPAVREIAALPGDGFVAVDAAGDLLVCAGARIVRRFPGAAVNPEAVTVDPTGTLAAVGSGAGDVLLLDLSRGTVLRTLRGHDQTVTALAFLPDRSRLVSAARDATVRVWDPGREDSLVVLRCGISPMHAIAISPDGRRIAASGEDDVVRTWCAADAR